VYKWLHGRIFGSTDGLIIPSEVFVAQKDNGDTFGVVSGHWNFDKSFYIQYAGILPEYQKGAYLRHINAILKNIGKSFITVTANTNIPAMKTLLAIGFVPIGTRTDVKDGTFYVEWSRSE
jgi:hypothetical protein